MIKETWKWGITGHIIPAGIEKIQNYTGIKRGLMDCPGKRHFTYKMDPVKSIMDAGGVVANHSDYPVSPLFSAVEAFCMGVLKKLPCRSVILNRTLMSREHFLPHSGMPQAGWKLAYSAQCQ